MLKPRMLTPGPTPVPEDVLLELAQPMVVYHRSARYRELLGRVTEDLKHVFQTSQSVLTLTASGTGGMEAALVSAVPAGASAPRSRLLQPPRAGQCSSPASPS